MQGTSYWLWRFNPLLLILLGEISLSLLCLHSSCCSALNLAPLLHVGHLRVSVLRSDKTGLQEQLIWGLWLTQARGKEWYRMWCEPVVTEASVTLQQPEEDSVFSRGSCPCITELWQWRAAQALRRSGVDNDLCLHTGFLLAAAAALTSHARLWCLRWYPWLMPISGAHLGSALNPLSSQTLK